MFEAISIWHKKPKKTHHYYLAGILVLCMLLLVLVMCSAPIWNGFARGSSVVSDEPIQREFTVDSGDTIYEILMENGVSEKMVDDIVEESKDIFDLSKITAGHQIVLTLSPNGEKLSSLEYEVSGAAWLSVSIADDEITAKERVVDLILPAFYTGPMKKIDIMVKAGDNIYGLLQEQKISPFQISMLLKNSNPTFDFSKITPGHMLSVWVTEELPRRIGGLIYSIDDLSTLKVSPQNSKFKVEKHTLTLETRVEMAEGTIQNSLYESAVAAGLGPEIVMDLSDIFAWEINFFSDIRAGDSFAVVYERYYVKEKNLPKGYGRVLAAGFITQGKEHIAIYYDNDKGTKGYYNEKGKTLKKQFLKAPLNYRRISSGFSYRRMHPIYHIVRPHLGVDYAAPTGTPVVALGDGRVVYCGWYKGFGKLVRIHHSGGYMTYYGHLSRFAKGMRVGKHVSQGQVIGYVGATGVATGPHLDFRVKKGGNFIKPSKVGAVKGPSLGGKDLAAFKVIANERLVLLKGKYPVIVADTNK